MRMEPLKPGGAWVTDIDRFAMHDGPGIRMTVFVKGCPLRCSWCHSPETQRMGPELLYQRARCRSCLTCVQACRAGAIAPAGADGGIQVDRALCRGCFRCTRACIFRALRAAGRQVLADEVLELARRDAEFYRQSGGGVTISGGEPLLYPDFCRSIFQGLRELGIHTAIETCGQGDGDALERMAREIDLIYFDVKALDPQKHRRLTGVDNEQILVNLARLCAQEDLRGRVVVRTPCIPGVNDSPEEIDRIAAYAEGLGLGRMQIMPYNAMAGAKYEWIGRAFALGAAAPRDKAYYEKLRERVASHHLQQ